MVDALTRDCIRSSLREHEIGGGSPYRLCFARKGKSGASFGYMQGDLAAGQQEAKTTFVACLSKADFSQEETSVLLAQLSVHCPINPLSTEDTEHINDALKAGADLIDKMDDQILQAVINNVDRCIATATASGRTVTPEALTYIALWINMTGAPTELLRWLSGKAPRLPTQPQPAPLVIDGDAIRGYVSCSYYYEENPRNLERLKVCVDRGIFKSKA